MTASIHKPASKRGYHGAIALSFLTSTLGCSTPTAPPPSNSQPPQASATTQAEQVTLAIDGSSTVYPLTDEAVPQQVEVSLKKRGA